MWEQSSALFSSPSSPSLHSICCFFTHTNPAFSCLREAVCCPGQSRFVTAGAGKTNLRHMFRLQRSQFGARPQLCLWIWRKETEFLQKPDLMMKKQPLLTNLSCVVFACYGIAVISQELCFLWMFTCVWARKAGGWKVLGNADTHWTACIDMFGLSVLTLRMCSSYSC